jgi:hypothetical protein
MEHAPASPEPLLIGRERERALLWSHYQAAASGQTHVVLIEGLLGIGKTCLLEFSPCYDVAVSGSRENLEHIEYEVFQL